MYQHSLYLDSLRSLDQVWIKDVATLLGCKSQEPELGVP